MGGVPNWHELAITGRVITVTQTCIVAGLVLIVCLALVDVWRQSRRAAKDDDR